MSKNGFLALAVGLMAAACSGAEETTPTAAQQLVMQAFQPTLKRLGTDAKLEYEGEYSVRISYLPQKFKIHGVGKSGEIATETHDEIGPSAKGFVLNIHLQPQGEVNQAVTPQTVRRPYWLTDLDVTRVGQTDMQIYSGLSYGARTDKKLLDEVRQRLGSVGE